MIADEMQRGIILAKLFLPVLDVPPTLTLSPSLSLSAVSGDFVFFQLLFLRPKTR